MTNRKHNRDVRHIVQELDGLGTLSEQLKAAESYLRERISWVDNRGRRIQLPSPLLAIDLNLSTEEYRWLTEILGQVLDGATRKPVVLRKLFEDYPLVFIAVLTGVALLDSGDSYWSAVWRELHVSDSDRLYQTICQGLPKALQRNRLATFDTADLTGRDYVNLIRLHSGITARDIHPLIACYDQVREEPGADTSGEQLSLRISEGPDGRFSDSLRNLCRHIPDRSAEFFDRITEVTEWYRALEDKTEVRNFEGTHNLPEPTFTNLLALLGGNAPEATTPAPDKLHRITPPHLFLDLEESELRLIFPAVSQQQATELDDLGWTVILNDRSIRIQPEKDWSTGGFAEYQMPLSSPFSRLQVLHPNGSIDTLVENLGDRRPMLFFHSNGRVLRNQGSLSGQEVITIMPSMARVTGPSSPKVQTLGPVYGWQNWEIRSIGLAGVTDLSFNCSHFRTSIPVKAHREVTWRDQDSVIAHLRGTDGLAVHSASPRIIIPRSDTRWLLRYSQLLPDGTVLPMDDYEVEDELRGVPFDVFDPADDAWVGRYRVEVFKNGKLHHSRVFNLAEGLELTLTYPKYLSTGSFRAPAPELKETNLTKVIAKFQAAENAGLRYPQEDFSLRNQSSGQILRITSSTAPEDYFLDTYVLPAQLKFRPELRHHLSKWSTTRTTIDFDDFGEGDFQISFPQQVHDVCLSFVEMQPGRAPREAGTAAMSRKGSSNTWAVPMSRIRSSMEKDAQFVIIAQWHTMTERDHVNKRLSDREQKAWWRQSQNEREDPRLRTMPRSTLAVVTKHPLITGATVDDHIITLELGRSASQQLEAWVWSVHAPLDAPVKLDLNGLTGTLPRDHQLHGPLIIEAREKEFLSRWTPTTPSAAAVIANQDSHLEPHLDPLINHRWLFASTNSAQLRPREIRTVWEARDALHHVLSVKENRKFPSIKAFDDATSDHLLADPRISLDELDRSSIPSEAHFEAFIRSGLGTHSFATAETGGDIHGVPWIGLIQEMNDLRVLRARSSADSAVVDERAESKSYIQDVGGQDLWTMFNGGVHGVPLVQQHYPGPADIQLVRDHSIDSLREQMAISPSEDGFISGNSRLNAQLEWLQNRRDLMKVTQLRELFTATSEWENLIDHLGDPGLKVTARQLFTAAEEQYRRAEDNWLYAPYVSFVLSMLSRMTAHGFIRPIEHLRTLRHVWATCARSVPALTGFDLVVAEAKVLNAKSGI